MQNPSRRTVLATLAAGWSLPALADAPVVLKLAHSAAENNPRHLAAVRFAELAAKSTQGRVRVDVYPASKLADDGAALEGLATGKVDLTANSQGPVAKLVPTYACLGLPYTFRTQQQVWRVLRGPIGEQLRKLSEAQGMVVLALWDNGFRHVTTTARPIREPADLKGLKLRTPADAATMDFVRALGGEPVAVKFSELPEALRTGKVDGQENPLVNIYTAELFKVQKYLALTNHKYETTPLVMSKLVWDKLSAADRAGLREAAADATVYQRELMLKAEERALNRLVQAGMRTDYPNFARFAEASKPVVDQWLAGPNGEFTRALIAAAKEADLGG